MEGQARSRLVGSLRTRGICEEAQSIDADEVAETIISEGSKMLGELVQRAFHIPRADPSFNQQNLSTKNVDVSSIMKLSTILHT